MRYSVTTTADLTGIQLDFAIHSHQTMTAILATLLGFGVLFFEHLSKLGTFNISKLFFIKFPKDYSITIILAPFCLVVTIGLLFIPEFMLTKEPVYAQLGNIIVTVATPTILYLFLFAIPIIIGLLRILYVATKAAIKPLHKAIKDRLVKNNTSTSYDLLNEYNLRFFIAAFLGFTGVLELNSVLRSPETAVSLLEISFTLLALYLSAQLSLDFIRAVSHSTETNRIPDDVKTPDLNKSPILAGFTGIVVGMMTVIGAIAAVMVVPEFREIFGLENEQLPVETMETPIPTRTEYIIVTETPNFSDN